VRQVLYDFSEILIGTEKLGALAGKSSDNRIILKFKHSFRFAIEPPKNVLLTPIHGIIHYIHPTFSQKQGYCPLFE